MNSWDEVAGGEQFLNCKITHRCGILSQAELLMVAPLRLGEKITISEEYSFSERGCEVQSCYFWAFSILLIVKSNLGPSRRSSTGY